MSQKVQNTVPSTIETIDGAFLDYVEGLNLFCNTINGFEKVPVIWSSAERAYQIKNNRELRDKNGSLIPPIISIERTSTTKDPQKKGSFQANLSPKNDRFIYKTSINQDKTSQFANTDSLRNSGQINFVTSKKNQKIVYTYEKIRIPVYVTVEYKIYILTNYQSQMNEIIQPFMSRVAQNYFLINKDGHNYECFMDQNFQQESIANLNEEERKYKSSITVKVLGYLIGEGDNQEQPQIEKEENAVEFKFQNETLTFVDNNGRPINAETARRATNQGQLTYSGLTYKKVFIIGDGVNSQYLVQHNFNSRDLFILVRENFGDYGQVEVAIDHTDLNHIDIDMGDPIPVNSYTVMIIG